LGGRDFQALYVSTASGNYQLYEVVALKAREWNRYGNIGLVAGATFPQELKRLRALCPEMLFLAPGIGAQGGDLAQAVAGGIDSSGKGLILSTSREVLYATRGPDFATRSRRMAQALRDQVNALVAASQAAR